MFNGSAISFSKNSGKIVVSVSGTGKLEFITGTTDIKNSDNKIEKKFGIKGNYPNPFNPSTTIYCMVNSSKPFYVKVYDLYGRMVKDLYHGAGMNGLMNIQWDGTDNNGSSVSSGIYVFELSNGMDYDRKKGILLK